MTTSTAQRPQASLALRSALHVACVAGPDLGVVLPIPCLIGRESGLIDPRLSRAHARIDLDSPGATITDLGSLNGTYVGRPRMWRRCRNGRAHRVAAGRRFRVGDDVFVVRPRPTSFDAPKHRETSTRRLLPLVLLIAMGAWRLSHAVPGRWLWGIGLMIALTIGGVVARRMRRRSAGERIDAAALALRLAALAEPGRGGASADASSATADASSPRPTGMRLRPPRRSGRRRPPILEPDPESTTRAFGCVGVDCELMALWLAAQIASHQGGALIRTYDGTDRLLGSGGAPIHITSHDHCSLCEEHGDDGVRHIGVGSSYADLPSWCTSVIDARESPCSRGWWAQVSTDVDSSSTLPDEIDLSELLDGHPQRGAPYASLAAPVGLDEDGPHILDLVTDGPHALVAGSTGSGKSAALLTWLLAIASRYSPDEVRFLLIDFKGGATFARLGDLPHTHRVLTDLDEDGADRALRALAALIRAREQRLSEHALADYAAWASAFAAGASPCPPPRLLVVVDEFRVLADEYPDALDALMRLAAQGRSLGLHLIAATQRPGGAINATMRANMELRIALRCVSERDSLDLVGDVSAARLPRFPGRAVIADRTIIQFAYAGDANRMIDALRAGSRRREEIDWAADLPRTLSTDEARALPPPRRPVGAFDARFSRRDVDGPPTPVVLGLLDGVDEGAHTRFEWCGSSLLVAAPVHEGRLVERAVDAIGARLSAHLRLPLHRVASSSGGPTTSDLRFDDEGDIALLLDSIVDHGPCVLALEDMGAVSRALESALGTVKGPQLLSGLLANAAARGVLVIAGSTGSRPASRALADPFQSKLLRTEPGGLMWWGLSKTYVPRRESDWLLTGEDASSALVMLADAEASPDEADGPAATSRRMWRVVPWSRAETMERKTNGVDPTSDWHARVGAGWMPARLAPSSPWILVSDDPDDEKMLRTVLACDGAERVDIEYIPSAHWTRLGAKRLTNLVALTPTMEVLRALDRCPARIPTGLLLRNWAKKTGLMLSGGVWTRVGFTRQSPP